MIHISVELWPGGDRSRAQDLGTAEIANLSDLAEVSSYSVRLLKGKRYSPRNAGSLYKEGKVRAFPRASTCWGPWELLYLGLEATIGPRIVSLKRYLSAFHERPFVAPTCTWTEQEEGAYWETACENAFMLSAGTPSENGIEFCPFCGRPIE